MQIRRTCGERLICTLTFVGGSWPLVHDMASLQLSLGSQSGEQATSSYSRTTRITQKLIVNSTSMLPTFTPVEHSNAKHLLQATGCPYLEGMEGSVVRDVVFSAGEARIRIIQWLVARWGPCLYGIVASGPLLLQLPPN